MKYLPFREIDKGLQAILAHTKIELTNKDRKAIYREAKIALKHTKISDPTPNRCATAAFSGLLIAHAALPDDSKLLTQNLLQQTVHFAKKHKDVDMNELPQYVLAFVPTLSWNEFDDLVEELDRGFEASYSEDLQEGFEKDGGFLLLVVAIMIIINYSFTLEDEVGKVLKWFMLGAAGLDNLMATK